MTITDISKCSVKQLQLLSLHAPDAKTRAAAAKRLQELKGAPKR